MLQVEMWERQGRAVKEAELGTPAKEVRKRGAKDEPVDSTAAAAAAAEEEAEVRCAPRILCDHARRVSSFLL